VTDSAGRRPGSWRALALFVAPVLAIGLGIGSLTAPDGWYAALAKPSFNPPNWIFPPVWTVLYVLIGAAGWRVWRLRGGGPLRALWSAQLVLNFAWTPSFFVLHRIGLAFGVIALLLLAILAFVAFAWKRDRVAALLFLPYAAWVAFAAALTAAIWQLN
jgi:translocator protein